MTFAIAIDQFKNGTKDVTRRLGWWHLKPGDIISALEKRGDELNSLGFIEIVSTRAEPISAITLDDVRREGFPDYTAAQFVEMISTHYNVGPNHIINRIEFKRCQNT